MKINRITIGLFMAALIGLAYLGSRVYIDSRLELVDVPVVLTELAPRTQIKEDMIGMVKMPKAYLPPF